MVAAPHGAGDLAARRRSARPLLAHRRRLVLAEPRVAIPGNLLRVLQSWRPPASDRGLRGGHYGGVGDCVAARALREPAPAGRRRDRTARIVDGVDASAAGADA